VQQAKFLNPEENKIILKEQENLNRMKGIFEKEGSWPENIIQFYEGWNDKDEYYLALEYCRDGNLRNLIDLYSGRKERIPEDLIRSILYQMAAGISSLHLHGFVHRDIKPENVLMINNPLVKIADYGTARYEDLSLSKLQLPNLTTGIGTTSYMSPQIENGEPYGAKCDIWSMGVLLLEIMSQLTPKFIYTNFAYFIQQKKQEEIDKFCRFQLKDYSPELSDLVCMMIKIDEKDRIGIDSLIQHPIYLVIVGFYFALWGTRPSTRAPKVSNFKRLRGRLSSWRLLILNSRK